MSKKKRVMIQNKIDGDLEHDFTCKIEKGIYKLIYSDSPEWSEFLKGKECISLKDDGDNVSIKGIKPKLNYSELIQLYSLLKVFYNVQKQKVKIK
jgi:hypothetical protein